MAITRLALSTPSANANTFLYTMTKNAIVSIIATNKGTAATTIRAWAVPSGATLESQYAFLAYDTVVPSANSIETFRFAVEYGDSIYIRASSADVSFSLNGIYETNGKTSIFTQTTAPTSPSIGDVWVDPVADTVYFWDGSMWQTVNNVAAQAGNANKILMTNGTNTYWSIKAVSPLPDATLGAGTTPGSTGIHNIVISQSAPVLGSNDTGTSNGDVWFVYI